MPANHSLSGSDIPFRPPQDVSLNGSVQTGDRVRVDIPDTTDADHDAYHGRQGVVVEVLADDAGAETANPIDSKIYRVEFDDRETADFRRRDLRPPLDGPN